MEERCINSSKRTDITINEPNGSKKYFDTTVTCPIPGSNGGINNISMNEAKVPGRAEFKAKQHKIKKYRDEVGEEESFLPIVFESTGRLDADSLKFLYSISKKASEVKSIPTDVIYKWFIKNLSITFQKTTATMIINKAHLVRSKFQGDFTTNHAAVFYDEGWR